ncbi:MAG: glycosyl hydrolase [Candidatus Brocadiaceae bacterium]
MQIDDQLAALLEDPPARYRPMPVWSWNGDVSEERITEMLEQFAEQGMGGVFVTPRWGLITDYLSEQWFDLWEFALGECKRLGLECHIYDEFLVPSGFAGGHVIANDPVVVARYLAAEVYCEPPRRTPGGFVAAFALSGEGGPERVDGDALEQASPENPVLVLEQRKCGPSPGQGGFPRPDILRRDAVALFLELTHQRYAERCGEDFGTAVKYAFTDEPNVNWARGGVPWSRHLLREFRRDHGYGLEERVGELWFDGEGSPAVRFDYFSTVNRLFVDSFARQIYDWCAEHDLGSTGHFMENTWPSPFWQPDTMALMRWQQVPGNDLLAFQFDPSDRRENGRYRLNLKELSSVANQLGREMVCVETSGAGGYDTAFETFKPLEDFCLVHGVNVNNPHLSHMTLAGARKYEWPQTIGDHAPWWSSYRHHADHVSRVAAVLSQGRERNRVLLLHPTTTAWLYARPPSPSSVHAEKGDELNRIADEQVALVEALAADQIDFDLGDEFILAELGSAQDGALQVGAHCYDLVILPATMGNWTAGTLQLMTDYMAEGGRVFAAGATAPRYVNGRESAAPGELLERYSGQWQVFEDRAELVAAVRKAVPPRLSRPDGSPLPPEVCVRRVETPAGQTVIYLCNPWNAEVEADVRLEGTRLFEVDTASGELRAIASHAEGGHQVAHLALPARGHALWIVGQEGSSRPRRQSTRPADSSGTQIELGEPAIARLSPNVLTLDYCDLEVEGMLHEGIATVHADRLNWRANGWEGNPWRMVPQFRRTIVDRPVDPDSGFVVRYSFSVEPDFLDTGSTGVRLAVERPHLYRVCLNGNELPFADAERWFDEEIRTVPVSAHLRSGENVIELEARPFRTLCEIMPLYLLGDFSLKPSDKGFCLVAPRQPDMGDWTTQGMPFYADVTRYSFSFHLDEESAGLRVSLGEWSGPVVRVRLDGAEAGAIIHPPYELDVGGAVSAGSHELSLDVVGNLRNMLGPHFCDGLAGPWSWEACPDAAPPGSVYTLQPTGLFGRPELVAYAGSGSVSQQQDE